MTVVLEILASQERPSSLSDIAAAAGLDKSTAFRFLRAFERQRIVRRDPDTLRYSLGIRIIEWAGQALDRIDVAKAAEPVLAQLNLQTRESVGLFVKEAHLRTAVAVYNSPRMTVVALRLGWTAPLPLGAAGKVLLAYLPERVVCEVFDAHPHIDPAVRRRIETELPQIRRNGYGTSVREVSDHAWSVAAPVFGAGGPIASISISSPGSRYSPENEACFIEQILAARDEISRMMGGGTRVRNVDRGQNETVGIDD